MKNILLLISMLFVKTYLQLIQTFLDSQLAPGRVTTRINESAKPKKTAPVNEWSYEVDDTLLELAGLKK